MQEIKDGGFNYRYGYSKIKPTSLEKGDSLEGSSLKANQTKKNKQKEKLNPRGFQPQGEQYKKLKSNYKINCKI